MSDIVVSGFTDQVLACAAWGAIAVLLTLFCLDLLVIMVGEARAAGSPDAPADPDEFAHAPELSEIITTSGGARLRFDALTAVVSIALAASPVAAAASLAAAWFAPAWLRAAAGALVLATTLVAGRPAILEALRRAGF